MGKATFNVAEAHHYVAPRTDAVRCVARVLVSKGAYHHLGMHPLHSLGHLVDKPEHQPALPAVFLGQACALGALAIAFVVVLRHVVAPIAGLLANHFQQPLRHDLHQRLALAETELAIANALPIAQGEIFGMRLKEIVGRHQAGEGVDAPVGRQFAVGTVRRLADVVHAVVGAPFGMAQHLLVHRHTPKDGGPFAHIECAQAFGLQLGHFRKRRRVPPYAQFVLEKGKHAIHRSPLLATIYI